jgi:general secretion pathway protein B
MSLILEALRKSEAERRRGSTPDVAMELPPVPVARARATPAWVLPVSAIAIVALLGGWWWTQRDAAGTDASRPVAESSATEPGIEAAAPPVVVARAPMPPAPVATQAPATEPVPEPAAPSIVGPAPMPVPARPAPTLPPPPPPTTTREVADIEATSIPPVKLSMHMWDESPSRRFVILDGQRMVEGDRSGELSVVAIERDGVIVERNGQRARVPLP